MIADNFQKSVEQWIVVTPGTIQRVGTSITIEHRPANGSPYWTFWNGEHVFGGLHRSPAEAKAFADELIERLLEMGQVP